MAFPHQKLAVYQESLLFVKWVQVVLRPIVRSKNAALADQISRAAISIPLNIAEGCGRWAKNDKRRFYQIAQGSIAECDAALDVIEASEFYDTTSMDWGEERARLGKVCAWLVGLIRHVESRAE